jgi:hypothetical protein
MHWPAGAWDVHSIQKANPISKKRSKTSENVPRYTPYEIARSCHLTGYLKLGRGWITIRHHNAGSVSTRPFPYPCPTVIATLALACLLVPIADVSLAQAFDAGAGFLPEVAIRGRGWSQFANPGEMIEYGLGLLEVFRVDGRDRLPSDKPRRTAKAGGLRGAADPVRLWPDRDGGRLSDHASRLSDRVRDLRHWRPAAVQDGSRLGGGHHAADPRHAGRSLRRARSAGCRANHGRQRLGDRLCARAARRITRSRCGSRPRKRRRTASTCWASALPHAGSNRYPSRNPASSAPRSMSLAAPAGLGRDALLHEMERIATEERAGIDEWRVD